MADLRTEIVFVDVDDTLTRSAGTKRIAMTAVVERVFNVARIESSRGIANFENLYKPLVDAWALYDSSGDDPVLLDWSEKR